MLQSYVHHFIIDLLGMTVRLQVVAPLIRRYKQTLPDKQCRHLCMKVMHALYKTTKGLESEGGNQSNDHHTVDDDASNPCTLTWSNLGAAMLAMKRHMICVMHETLNEDTSSPQVCAHACMPAF